MTHDSLRRAILAPDSVALIGASGDPDKTSSRPLRFLRRAGWEGRIYPINPTRSEVLGERAWPSIDALPEVPDHAYILTDADTAVHAVRACAERGVRVATIMADGFVDADPGGTARRTELERIVHDAGIRLVGPSSLGVVNVPGRLALTANAAFAESDLPVGSVFVASHSGSVIGALVSRGKAMGVGFAGLVSTGGEVDLSLGEICMSTVDDPQVGSYALFLESLSGSDRLREFATAAAARGKPVLAYKLGRSKAGAELSVSHTGALAGDDAVATALLTDLGIGRVDTFEALLEGQQLARSVVLTERPNRAPRVAVVTTTGGGGAMVVDRLAVLGAEVHGPGERTRSRLAELGVSAEHGRLVDLTLAGTRYQVMRSTLDVLLSAPEFDAVVAVAGSSARFHPELAVRPIADSVRPDKPLAAFIVPEAPDALRLLREAGVSAFRTPEACADAVIAAFARRLPAAAPAGPAPVTSGSRVLDEAVSYRVLERLGVPYAPYAVLPAHEDPPALPVPGPAVVKALSDKLAHKSDVDGVVMNVSDVRELRDAISGIRSSVRQHLPEIELRDVLVQRMARGLGEVLVGYRHDPAAGPIVILAAGGMLAEIVRDRSVRTAPVDLATARDMIAEVVSLRALSGYRGAERGDLDALAEAVAAMSRAALLESPCVIEAEANPVVVLPEGHGVVAVDALVRVAGEAP
ncbi:MAG: CoA-binding protein [Pseudonocardiaceae bacterium]|nr:CoA-binding protein [Pseudonocardiaceae bacterium]